MVLEVSRLDIHVHQLERYSAPSIMFRARYPDIQNIKNCRSSYGHAIPIHSEKCSTYMTLAETRLELHHLPEYTQIIVSYRLPNDDDFIFCKNEAKMCSIFEALHI